MQVLDLKTNLQRVRVSNERRRAKVSERWIARAAATAEDSKAAVERQRGFARQLKRDVDELEGKLSGLDRQVHFVLHNPLFLMQIDACWFRRNCGNISKLEVGKVSFPSSSLCTVYVE